MKAVVVAVAVAVLMGMASGARDLICYEPPMLDTQTHCMALIHAFTFNATSKQCEPFVYGGCYGSPNLFYTVEACQQTCAEKEVAGCLYNGTEYAVGDGFKVDCNYCHCGGNNMAGCTLMGCLHGVNMPEESNP